jgi:hypothetical protein
MPKVPIEGSEHALTVVSKAALDNAAEPKMKKLQVEVSRLERGRCWTRPIGVEIGRCGGASGYDAVELTFGVQQ